MPRRKAILPTTNPLPPPQLPPKTVWEALNEPVVEVTPQAAQKLVLVALVLLIASYVGPYWSLAEQVNEPKSMAMLSHWDSALLHERTAYGSGGVVAGSMTASEPSLFDVASSLPDSISLAFAEAADEVLDISEPVSEMTGFFEPGISAVSDAWLELMADPY